MTRTTLRPRGGSHHVSAELPSQPAITRAGNTPPVARSRRGRAYRRVMAATTPLSGRRALITGGASGIGRACAVRLADAGAEVVVGDRDAEAAKSVAASVGGIAVAVDLSDLDAVDALDLDVDILVNNAGLQHVAPLQEFPPDRFSYILRLMLEAPFRLVRGALPHMYEQGWGRVVNISSIHGLRASAYKSAYVTAKHGLEGLSKVIAVEGAEHGVTSNCVNPAYVRPPRVEGQIADQPKAHGLSETRSSSRSCWRRPRSSGSSSPRRW